MRDNRLEELKDAYYGIEIPEELESIVNVSIRKARRDTMREKKNMKRKFPVWGKVSVSFAAAMLALVLLVNTNQNIAYAMSEVPVLGALVKVVTFNTFDSKDKDMSAHVETPKVEVETEEGNTENAKMEESVEVLNKTVEDYTNQVIEQYKADVAAAGEKTGEVIGETGKMDLNTDYEVVTDSDKMFSLKMQTVIVLNSANTTTKIYHINKKTGEMVTLSEIFKDDVDFKTVISEEIMRQMREETAATDGQKSYFLDNEDTPQLNWTGIADDANFYFNEDGKLTFIFDKYEVAPGYMGVCEFVIPSKVTDSILLEYYVD